MQGGGIAIPRVYIWIQTTFNITTGDLIVPLVADVTTVNVQNNQMYVTSTAISLSVFSSPFALYMITDPGYEGKSLYEYSKKMLCCMIRKTVRAIPRL